MTLKQPPRREDLERLVSAGSQSLETRVANLKIFYDCINERDHEIERQRRIIERRDQEIERQKERIKQLEREKRSRPRTPEQIQALAARSEWRGKLLDDILGDIHELVERASAVRDAVEEEVTSPE